MRLRLKIAQRHQPVIGIDHGIDADAVGMGKLPDGRQFGTCTQGPVIHHLAKSPNDLGDQRNS